MKIILCTFLLCITAVSVFGQSVELNSILGESVKFPAAVKNGGFLIHRNFTIGEVTSGSFRTSHNENYRDRVQWDSSTGLFSLSGLKMEDSGEYKVQNTDQKITTVFQLNVHTVSVFGTELNRIVRKSIKFPAAVEKGGSLMYSGDTIGAVASGSFRTSRDVNYRDRVQWDSITGLFSLSGLREQDSGEYKVQNTDKKIITVFQLNVYIPVSKPSIKFTSNKYPCYLNCTMDRGTGVNMSWYRVGEKDHYGNLDFLDPPYLKLTLRVHKDGSYICEGKNPVSNETSDPFTVGANCTDGAVGIWQTEGSKMWSLSLVLIAMVYSHLV